MPTPPTPEVTHYAPFGTNAACKSADKNPVTARPPLVTCEKCRATSTYLSMTEESPE